MLILMLQQAAEQKEQQIQIAQETVIAIIVASTVVVLGLLWLIGRFASVAPTSEGPLRYGNFFVVIFGIMTVLIGFLVAFPLVISNVFTDPTQVIALLSALFGTIVGLVGTYFGVKSSSDASQQAQDLAQQATRMNLGQADGTSDEPTTAPTIDGATRTSTSGAGSTKEPAKPGSQSNRTEHAPSSQEDK